MEGENKPSLLNRLKDATNVVATRAREGVEELQTKHELSQAYGDLGRKTAELVESGAVTHAELTERVEKIRALKEQLEAEPDEPAATSEPAEPSEPAPPGESTPG